jgi:ribosome recycling factor
MDIEQDGPDARPVSVKPWDQAMIELRLKRVLDAVFNSDYKLDWSDQSSTILVNITVGNGFESERVERVAHKLQLIFNSIAKAHGRNLRLWMSEGNVAA